MAQSSWSWWRRLFVTISYARSGGHIRHCSTETGRIAAKQPFQVTLVPGKTYFWCRCGLSKKQPYCDGSHKVTKLRPVKFSVKEQNSEAFLCGCKQTGSPPYCDGTHATAQVQESTTD